MAFLFQVYRILGDFKLLKLPPQDRKDTAYAATHYIYFHVARIFLTSHQEQKCRPSVEFTATEDTMPLMLYCNNQTDQVANTMYITMICRTANSWEVFLQSLALCSSLEQFLLQVLQICQVKSRSTIFIYAKCVEKHG